MKKILCFILVFILGITSTLASLWYFKDKLLDYQGLALIQQAELKDLKQSKKKLKKAQKVVHGHKQSIKARQTKRVAKRVTAATSATLIPYVDTAVMPVIILGMEAQDYCEQQKELQEILDVFSGSETQFDIEQCLLQAQEEVQESIQSTSKDIDAAIDSFMKDFNRKKQEFFDSIFEKYLPTQ